MGTNHVEIIITRGRVVDLRQLSLGQHFKYFDGFYNITGIINYCDGVCDGQCHVSAPMSENSSSENTPSPSPQIHGHHYLNNDESNDNFTFHSLTSAIRFELDGSIDFDNTLDYITDKQHKIT